MNKTILKSVKRFLAFTLAFLMTLQIPLTHLSMNVHAEEITATTTTVSGTVSWEGDSENTRPESVTVKLLQNDAEVSSVDVTAENDWAFSFDNLDINDEEGNAYTYSVQEAEVSGYEIAYDGYNITNTLAVSGQSEDDSEEGQDEPVPATTSVSGTISWVNDNEDSRPDSMTVKLLQNGAEVDSVDVTAENGWTYSFNDLAIADDEGTEYVYSVQGTEVEGYEVSYDGYNITFTLGEDKSDSDGDDNTDATPNKRANAGNGAAEDDIAIVDESGDVTTGTWSIKVNWGDPSENLPDDWCPVYEDESSVSVKTQITIEYRGDGTEIFEPKDIVITSQDIKDILIESLQYNVSTKVSTSALSMNSTGDGDWWYNRTYSTGEYKFYNKNTIEGSFTSTIQFNITFSRNGSYVARYFKQGYTKDVAANLTVNGETITSNTLNYSWQGTKDIYSLEWMPVKKLEWGNSILSKIDKDKWSDYIFVNVPIRYNLETGSSLYLQEGGHTDFNFPNDFVIGDGDVDAGNLFGNSSGDIFDFTNMGSTFGGTTGTWSDYQLIDAIPLAIPRSYLNVNNGVIEIKADWYGTYLGETDETLIASDTISFNLNDYNIVYDGDLYRQVKEHNPSYQDGAYLFTSSMKSGYNKATLTGNRTIWGIESSAIYYGVPYNLVIGDDLQYFIYSDNDYRKANEDEVVVSSVSLYKPNSDSDYEVEVYGRKAGASDYVLLDTVTITNWVTNVTISTDSDRYCDFKVKYLNLEETVTDLVTTVAIYIYDNESLDSGKTITDCYNFSYLQIELIDENGSVSLTPMEYSGITNIDGLEDKVVAIDNSRYGKTILRGVDSTPVKDPYYSAKINAYGCSFHYDDTNMIFRYPSVSHVMLLENIPESELNLKGNFIYSVTYPEYVKIDTETLVYSIQEDDDVNKRIWVTEEEFESKYDAKLSVSSVNNNDGTVTYNFNCDYKDGLSFTSDYRNNYIFNIKHDIFTTLDDYYLYGVATKKTTSTDKVDASSSYVVNMDDGTDYVYKCNSVTSTLTYPTIVSGSYQGVDIEVAGDNGLYQKSLLKVDYDDNYRYKLRVSSGDTRMTDIIMYYNIENYTPDTWKGDFKGYSFESMESIGINTSAFKVYYSSDRTQTQDLSASGWVLSSDWTGSISNVKSIAFDLDGYILEANSLLYIEVMMQAPSSTDNAKVGEITKSQDTVSYVEYDATDTNLNNPLKTTTNLPSNIVSVSLGEAKIDVNVNKIWSDNKNIEGTRPSGVTIHLYRNGTEIESCELKDSNGWKHSFNNLPMHDGSLNEYEYTVTEDSVAGYTGNTEYITIGDSVTVNITNTIETISVNGTKTWVDDTESDRPDSITLHLLQDGEVYKTATTNASKDWEYSFGDVVKYKKDGTEHEYSVQEETVEGYETLYGGTINENGLAVTFNSQCRMEGSSTYYDYVEIYYRLDGNTYKLGKWGGNSLAGKTLEIPSTDFYLYWHTDYSTCNYYGFSIDSIESKNVEIPSSPTAGTLPSYTPEELSGTDYPDSEFTADDGTKYTHGNYGNNVKKLWHYTGESVGTTEPRAGVYDVYNIKTETAFPLEFVKVDFLTGDAMGDVAFALYRLKCEDASHDHGKAGSTGCWESVSTGTSDADGKVSLDGLKKGNTYGVVETVPSGYTLPSNLYWKVDVADDGAITWITVCGSAELDAFNESYGWLGYSPDLSVKTDGSLELDNIQEMRSVKATKRIKASDINFANGNPTFLFKLTGTDVTGEDKTYYRHVEFTESYVTANTDADGYVALSTVFDDVVAGNYVLSENIVSRYEFASVSNISNGTANGQTVSFDLITNTSGCATYTNAIYEEQWFSHNDIVVNAIKK